MTIGVLTSSRADYSIYFPLLKALRADNRFTLEIIAFGTHLSELHGYTIKRIEEDGFSVKHSLQTLPENDTPEAITNSMGETMSKFSSLWSNAEFDLVFCLGDRYEMFAACASSVPFNIKLAHIHGGEETTGAIDNIFRHAITHMATYHFTAAEPYKQRVIELKGSANNVYNVGSLSIDNLKALKLYSIEEFKTNFNIDLQVPSILITFHPETVSLDKNEFFISELLAALSEIEEYQFVFTMPNADAMGNMIRRNINEFASRTPQAKVVESFGTVGYLSCMKHCLMMVGNTSSGFIEASFFPKFVINLGDRQKGRILTPNIYSCAIKRQEIIMAVKSYREIQSSSGNTLYGDGNAAIKIMNVLNGIQ
ncbi:MAG: UDP-N-acetylglucosamine 2-epimerase (hydrolyzing) [Bacteroidetes bacterium]|nr:UDP-N-acetylglucosamine 2-epimerase (hydrolyzing) [Bacteroidota bacterium]